MALLARRVGSRITRWMEADGFERVTIGFILLVLIGTAWSAFKMIRPGAAPQPATAQG